MYFKRKSKLIYFQYYKKTGKIEIDIEKISFQEGVNCISGNHLSGKTTIFDALKNSCDIIASKIKPVGIQQISIGLVNNLGEKIEYHLENKAQRIEESLRIDNKLNFERSDPSNITLNNEFYTFIQPQSLIVNLDFSETAYMQVEDLKNWAKEAFFINQNIHEQLAARIECYKQSGISLSNLLRDALPLFSDNDILFMENKLVYQDKIIELSAKLQQYIYFRILIAESLLKNNSRTFFIDDFADGADYMFSQEYSNALFYVAQNTDNQYITVSTNSYILDNIPLDKWLITKRKHSHISVLDLQNYQNKINNFKLSKTPNHRLLESAFIQKLCNE